jgi:hypothetical protein
MTERDTDRNGALGASSERATRSTSAVAGVPGAQPDNAPDKHWRRASQTTRLRPILQRCTFAVNQRDRASALAATFDYDKGVASGQVSQPVCTCREMLEVTRHRRRPAGAVSCSQTGSLPGRDEPLSPPCWRCLSSCGAAHRGSWAVDEIEPMTLTRHSISPPDNPSSFTACPARNEASLCQGVISDVIPGA